MPKLYARVNPRTDLEKRDRAGLRFTRNWLELIDIDDASLAALQEDPYLEVSDSPTVLVEVAATTQAGAIETTGADTNNPVKSEANDGSTGDAAQASDTGTASPAADEVIDDAGESNDQTGGDGESADGATDSAAAQDAGTGADDSQAEQAQGETGAELSAAEGAEASVKKPAKAKKRAAE